MIAHLICAALKSHGSFFLSKISLIQYKNVLSESLCAWFCEMILYAYGGKSATKASAKAIPRVHKRKKER